MKSLKSQIPHDDCLNIYQEKHVPITLYVYILDNFTYTYLGNFSDPRWTRNWIW